MNRLKTARASGLMEFAAMRQSDPAEYAERALASGSGSVPPAIRARIEAGIREYRARRGQAAASASVPRLDTSTDAGKFEQSQRLMAEQQAERLLGGI
jgi:hypothetical protein